MIPRPDNTEIKGHNDSIVYSIGKLYVLLNQYFSGVYGPFGLNPAKFNLLMFIKHIGKEKGISQNQLKNMLYVSAANITKLIDGLERQGLTRRVPSPQDRRVNLITITPEGSRLLDRVWPEHVKALNSLLEPCDTEAKKSFSEYLERFISDLAPKTKHA